MGAVRCAALGECARWYISIVAGLLLANPTLLLLRFYFGRCSRAEGVGPCSADVGAWLLQCVYGFSLSSWLHMFRLQSAALCVAALGYNDGSLRLVRVDRAVVQLVLQREMCQ